MHPPVSALHLQLRQLAVGQQLRHKLRLKDAIQGDDQVLRDVKHGLIRSEGERVKELGRQAGGAGQEVGVLEGEA